MSRPLADIVGARKRPDLMVRQQEEIRKAIAPLKGRQDARPLSSSGLRDHHVLASPQRGNAPWIACLAAKSALLASPQSARRWGVGGACREGMRWH